MFKFTVFAAVLLASANLCFGQVANPANITSQKHEKKAEEKWVTVPVSGTSETIRLLLTAKEKCQYYEGNEEKDCYERWLEIPPKHRQPLQGNEIEFFNPLLDARMRTTKKSYCTFKNQSVTDSQCNREFEWMKKTKAKIT